MKKAVALVIIGYLISVMSMEILAASKTETTFGVILNEYGDGLELNQETYEPIDSYYNYISYRGINAKPGSYIVTFATLDEYGDWEEREDYVQTLIPPATEKELEKYRQLGTEPKKEAK